MSNKLKLKEKPVKQKEAVYNYTLSDINRMKKEAAEEATAKVFTLLLAIPVSVMADKHGWGKIRCERFVDQILDRYECYEKGYVSIEDLQEDLLQNSGVQLMTKK